jgi:hypothetical protein
MPLSLISYGETGWKYSAKTAYLQMEDISTLDINKKWKTVKESC